MRVNGEEILLNNEVSILEFLNSKSLKSDRVVIELNGEIIGREDFKHITLKEDDEIEIIAFVGGG